MQRETLRIGGMTCVNCQNRIEQKLKTLPGVEDAAVSYAAGTAALAWDGGTVSLAEIRRAVESLGYRVLDGEGPSPAGVLRALGILALILALYTLLRALGGNAPGAAFPLARSGMGYGMALVIGLITSLHCTAMCGGINLSQTLRGNAAPKPPPGAVLLLPGVLYNAGRIASYTVIGIAAGALGSVIVLSGPFRGAVQLAAGVFMVIMGLNMLGLLPRLLPRLRRFIPRLPRLFSGGAGMRGVGNKSPLIVGLLNGFMPCGPLQAMQLYALSTGSPAAGGLSLFLFGMGTFPLMFGLGALGALLGSRFSPAVMKAGAVLVTVMGMTMFGYGWNLSGATAVFTRGGAGEGALMPEITDGIQIVNSTLSAGEYPAITVQRGIPVRWTIHAPAGSINGCNNRMIIREYGIEYSFQPGDNVIEFKPEKAGTFPYSCWMGMIRSRITVAEAGERITGADDPRHLPVPAGVDIPTDRIGIAALGEGVQTVRIELRDGGIEPAIIVVQRGVPVEWTVNNDSLDPGNYRLLFPAFAARLDMEQGDNLIRFIPDEDFAFSTADHVFYGYVKAAEDLSRLDTEALGEEVSRFETLIYPESSFETAAASCPCCGR